MFDRHGARPALRRTQMRALRVAFVVSCLLLLGARAVPPAAAQPPAQQPVYVIAFVPIHWQGSWDDFDRAAQVQLDLFVSASGIAQYATVEARFIHRNYTTQALDSPLLVSGLVAYGLLHEQADRYVGLTDGDLGAPRDRDVAGWTHGPGSLGVVAEAHFVEVTAHELGHTYGLCDEYDYGEWSWQNDLWRCPNPFPDNCAPIAGLWCNGAPAAGGRKSIMGGAGFRQDVAFNAASYSHLQAEFAALFGVPLPPPPPARPFDTAVIVADPALVRIDVDGTRHQLAPGAVFHPAVSPDGVWVIFSAAWRGTLDLYRVPTAGGAVERLTRDAGRETRPAWLPNGNVIFASDGAAGSRLLHLDVPSGTQTPLAGLPHPAEWPAVSDDGRQLAFAAAVDGQSEIFSVALGADGQPQPATLHRLTTDPALDVAPAWVPGGYKLAFSSLRGGTLAIYTLTPRTDAAPQLLYADEYANWAVHWLRDGRLLLHSAIAGDVRVRLVDAAGNVQALGAIGAAWPVALPTDR